MTMESGIRVTMAHVRAASVSGAGVLCAPGIRTWCSTRGVDLHRLAREGLPVELFEALPDAFARRAAAIARQEAAGGR